MTEPTIQHTRTHPRSTPALSTLMSSGWAEPTAQPEFSADAIELAGRRRAQLAAHFAGELLLLPAGPVKIRSNDVSHYFRAHTSFAYLTGLGAESDPDSVLAIDVDAEGLGHSTLFMRPSTGPGTGGVLPRPDGGVLARSSRDHGPGRIRARSRGETPRPPSSNPSARASDS